MCTVVHLSPVIVTLLARDHLFIVEHSQHVTVLLNTIHTQSPLYSTAIFGKSARCTFRDYSIFFFSHSELVLIQHYPFISVSF